MGISFKDYITGLQIRRGQHDLLFTDKRVGEIAAHLGHAYAQCFHRFFKKHCGCTPQQYRARRVAN